MNRGYPVWASLRVLVSQYFLFEQKIELLFFKTIQLQNWRRSFLQAIGELAPLAERLRGMREVRMTRQKHFCNLLQQHLLKEKVRKVLRSTLTRTTKTYFYFFC